MQYANNAELKKAIFKVWRVFNNEKSLALSVSTKNQDGSFTNGLATIWKAKRDGSESLAFKNFKSLTQPVDNKLFKVEYKDGPIYKENPTFTFVKIEEYVNTKQQLPAFGQRVAEQVFGKENLQPSNKNVPWEL